MKIINTRLHGMLDYLSAMILLFPWFSNYYTGGPDTRILAALGGITILVSLLTDYEFGLIKLLPMKAHLVFDVLSALFLLAMPWLFPVYHYQLYWPVLLGAGGLLVVVLSSSESYRITKKDLNITQP
jgi:hypothetical protein